MYKESDINSQNKYFLGIYTFGHDKNRGHWGVWHFSLTSGRTEICHVEKHEHERL